MHRPEKSEYDPYYEQYVSLAGTGDIVATLSAQPSAIERLVSGLPEEKGSFAYAEGKWSIKELLGHLIDGERMFAYRLLRISRGDETPIEGFEQDVYIENAHSNQRSFAELLEEFSLVRRTTLILVGDLDEAAAMRVGTANDVKITSRAIVYIMAGHIEHHLQVLKERYLI